MIQVQNPVISQTTRDFLRRKQVRINRVYPFASRVRDADSAWSGGKRNLAFKEVKRKLRGMCPYDKRCVYCEDSSAREIDHICPKNFYPELTFVFENYLYSCGSCNGPKSNDYSIRSAVTDQVVESKDFGGQPPAGNALFINPRIENPLTFMKLDLNLFIFVPVSNDQNSIEYQKADFTIGALGLNERGDLVNQRRKFHGIYFQLLESYCGDVGNMALAYRQPNRIASIKMLEHPTVWSEMKRQRNDYPDLLALFAVEPDALNW